MSLVFDTLKLSKTLGRVFTPEQAEVLTEALTINVNESLATKPDLFVLQSKLESKIDAVRVELESKIDAMRVELESKIDAMRVELESKIDGVRAELKADLSNFKVETIRWIVGAIAFNLLGTAGLMITIAKLVAQK